MPGPATALVLGTKSLGIPVNLTLSSSGRLRKRHGTAKNRGVRPSHHVDASGSVDRKVLQALEKIGVVEQDEEKGGRRITQSGNYFSVLSFYHHR